MLAGQIRLQERPYRQVSVRHAFYDVIIVLLSWMGGGGWGVGLLCVNVWIVDVPDHVKLHFDMMGWGFCENSLLPLNL